MYRLKDKNTKEEHKEKKTCQKRIKNPDLVADFTGHLP